MPAATSPAAQNPSYLVLALPALFQVPEFDAYVTGSVDVGFIELDKIASADYGHTTLFAVNAEDTALLPQTLPQMRRIALAAQKAMEEHRFNKNDISQMDYITSMLETLGNMAGQERLHREIPGDMLELATRHIADISGCRASPENFVLLSEPRLKKA